MTDDKLKKDDSVSSSEQPGRPVDHRRDIHLLHARRSRLPYELQFVVSTARQRSATFFEQDETCVSEIDRFFLRKEADSVVLDMVNDDGLHDGVPQLKGGRRDTLRLDDIIIFEFTITVA